MLLAFFSNSSSIQSKPNLHLMALVEQRVLHHGRPRLLPKVGFNFCFVKIQCVLDGWGLYILRINLYIRTVDLSNQKSGLHGVVCKINRSIVWQSASLIAEINGPDVHNTVPHSTSVGFGQNWRGGEGRREKNKGRKGNGEERDEGGGEEQGHAQVLEQPLIYRPIILITYIHMAVLEVLNVSIIDSIEWSLQKPKQD